MLRAAYALSWVVAGLMLPVSILGLFVEGAYRDGPWAVEAFRAGDLVTLAVALPLLVGSLILSGRGSRAAQAVWLGTLGYSIYNFAFYVFGARFNDFFALHIAVFSASLFALACAMASLDLRAVAARFSGTRGRRWIGAFLVLVGVGQGALWAFLLGRFAFTGELLADIPANGQHVVFALDLSLLVPTLVMTGVLLFRRKTLGFVLGPAVALFAFVYQLNLNLAAVFGDVADVPGVKAFPIEGIVFLAGFAIATAVLFLSRPRREAIAG